MDERISLLILLVLPSYMIVNNAAQVQHFQRDGFLIFLAPDKSYVIRNIYQIQFINRLVKTLKLLSLNTWNLIMFWSWWLNIWPAIRGAAWQRFAISRTIALPQGLQCCLLVLATDRQSIVSEGSNWMFKLRWFVICVGKVRMTTDYWPMSNSSPSPSSKLYLLFNSRSSRCALIFHLEIKISILTLHLSLLSSLMEGWEQLLKSEKFLAKTCQLSKIFEDGWGRGGCHSG